ncbi:uncharacterized protein LOC18444730 isoform X2 [Amborella trichopoda]|nr:uncharacterized protein LOC18444730 isoform X2 [Amborella trichopoda]XP_020529524.1 uncharacterized protein LOC18444730 isoform X2 [Amborella trichopoda]XP_020529525.1 uncharacterized protein LOC18444730 isoform X2 [Amborella trichopoda]XP_020529526.1 uncharacterized protein LOC18444730 isoform X2 [Amborella trichopoda]|eukprot:XP_020529523.1 uncharacterized protein LOC18444730 isoform X2 [Amborella trichopoda]
MQTVIIPNKCNERLVGLLHEAESRPIIVLCHGFRSSKVYRHPSLRPLMHGWPNRRSNLKDDSTIKALTTALTREGISAFRFDFSGNGESEGSFQYGNYWKEVEDLRSVVEYFSGAQRKTRAIIGHSKGGNAVLLYASKYHDVDTVVNVSGRFDLRQGIEGRLGKGFMEKIKNSGFIDVKDRNGKFDYRVTEESLMDRLNTDMSVATPMIAKHCRVLTIHGTKDEIIPVEDALEFDKLISNHKLHIIEGANHVYSSHRSELASTVVDFTKAGYQPENQQSEQVTDVNDQREG